MTIKEIDLKIAETYKNIADRSVIRILGNQIIDDLFARKREAIALKAEPEAKPKPKYKK